MRQRWLSKRALLYHLILLICLPGCFVAAWWQVTVALGGNVFGYLYSVEWPVFAVLGTIAWWQLIHDDPETIRARRLQLIPHHDRIQPEDAEGSDKSGDWDCEPSFDGMAPASDEPQVQLGHAPQYPQDAPQYAQEQDEEDQALIAYNLYLAQLAKNTKPKTWRNVNV